VVRVGIASGKGGTGKTTVATNLARVATMEGLGVLYLDCDVEEPNGQIFLKTEERWRHPVTLPVPRVDAETCDLCGRCGDICRFSAIVPIGERVLVFPQLCHSCGGCRLACPLQAITEVPREVGILTGGRLNGTEYLQGLLNVGEAMSPPVIRALKAVAPQAELVIVDAPPGTSCPMVEAVQGCDRVLVVTEPTPFGQHDLGLALDTIETLGIRCDVVVNRSGANDGATGDLCRDRGVDIIAELPDRRAVAEAYSRGELAVDADPEFRRRFISLLHRVLESA
jgi:MinD superfamily P-loop ATPase